MKNSYIKQWLLRACFAAFFIVIGVCMSCYAFLHWVRSYPDAIDPKNIDYVLWKNGLNRNMDLGKALVAMSEDDPLHLIKGMTKDQLAKKFGYVVAYEDAGSYLRKCFTHPAPGREVVFLRSSPLAVTLENGVATRIVLCKGY